MKPYRSALGVLFTAATLVMPCAAQPAGPTPQTLPIDHCPGCFAYLEFSTSPEPLSYAISAEAIETPTSLVAVGEPTGRLRERAAGLAATAKR
jgi:hypothetical protein